jgi:hypothetical protein
VRRARGDVTRARWTDPEDLTPSAARTARSVDGWRRFCPLRAMLAEDRYGIVEQHILAADRFRELVDLARLGYAPSPTGLFVALAAAPMTGNSPADRARNAAAREVERVMELYSPLERDLLCAIVLGNLRVAVWTRIMAEAGRQVSVGGEHRRLVVLLDRLALHFDSEISADVSRGRRLRV